jgi:hypothetical protein
LLIEGAFPNYSVWQNEMAKKSSLPQAIFALQVCSVQTAELLTSFEAQKMDRFMDVSVSTMALHSGHLIKRRDMLFTSQIVFSLFAEWMG